MIAPGLIALCVPARNRRHGRVRHDLIAKRSAALRLAIGDHVDEPDDSESPSVASRVADLDAARSCEAEA